MDVQLKKKHSLTAFLASNHAFDDNGIHLNVANPSTRSDNGPKRETVVFYRYGKRGVWREFDSRAPETEAVFARRSTEPLYNRTLGR